MTIYEGTMYGQPALISDCFIKSRFANGTASTTFYRFIENGDFAKARTELIANIKKEIKSNFEVERPPEAKTIYEVNVII